MERGIPTWAKKELRWELLPLAHIISLFIAIVALCVTHFVCLLYIHILLIICYALPFK